MKRIHVIQEFEPVCARVEELWEELRIPARECTYYRRTAFERRDGAGIEDVLLGFGRIVVSEIAVPSL